MQQIVSNSCYLSARWLKYSQQRLVLANLLEDRKSYFLFSSPVGYYMKLKEYAAMERQTNAVV